jgi:plastocyanin
MRLASLPFVILAAACAAPADPAGPGDDDPSPDGGPIETSVFEVDCAEAAVVATVETAGASYSPDQLTIAAGEVVRFDLGLGHDVRSDDDLFRLGFGADACLRFDEPGVFGYFCGPHGFRGEITVE